jgi:hypothetical protein
MDGQQHRQCVEARGEAMSAGHLHLHFSHVGSIRLPSLLGFAGLPAVPSLRLPIGEVKIEDRWGVECTITAPDGTVYKDRFEGKHAEVDAFAQNLREALTAVWGEAP